MRIWTTFALLLFGLPSVSAQQVVRISEPSAVNPAEVSIAINPKNPDNLIAASLQIQRPPKSRAGSYQYIPFDGGKTWKTVPTPNLSNLVQGDDIVVFSSDGVAYHVHLSFDGIRQARPARAENGMIVNISKDGGNTWTDGTAAINHVNTVTPFEDKPGMVVDNAPARVQKEMSTSPGRDLMFTAVPIPNTVRRSTSRAQPIRAKHSRCRFAFLIRVAIVSTAITLSRGRCRQLVQMVRFISCGPDRLDW